MEMASIFSSILFERNSFRMLCSTFLCVCTNVFVIDITIFLNIGNFLVLGPVAHSS